MLTFKIMTRQHGDQCQNFEANEAGLKAAEDRFRELTGSGFFAWAPASEAGPARQIRKFDAAETNVVFQPQLKGG